MMQRARAFGVARDDSSHGSSSSSPNGSMMDGTGGNDNLSSSSDLRSRSPSVIVRTGGTVFRKRRDLPWGIRLIQKCSDWWCAPGAVNRDFW